MQSKIEPMLCAECPEDLDSLKYPLIVQPKFDGVRSLVYGGKLMSRSGKEIPNKKLQNYYADLIYFASQRQMIPDGELVGQTFEQTQSIVMSQDLVEPITYVLFDVASSNFLSTIRRIDLLNVLIDDVRRMASDIRLRVTPYYVVNDKSQLLTYVDIYKDSEGLIIRSMEGQYKHGRSTTDEGLLMRLVQWKEDVATVIDYTKAFKIGTQMMGSLLVEHPKFGRFEIGTGFKKRERIEIMQNFHLYKARLLRFKYKPNHMKDKPQGVFLKFV